ncbi:MAG: cation diffusion facilitator family transporter [Candidatus Gracilibacteria bacterium]
MSGRNLIYGERIARSSLIKILVITGLKMMAAIMTGMVVMLADAISSLTDAVSLFASYIGLKLSRKSADQKFEYGYYKIETFGALLVSVLIIYFGYNVLVKALESLQGVPEGKAHYIGIIIAGISILFSINLAVKLTKAARKTNSISLMNNAKDKKLDIIGSFAVIASVLANMYQIQYIEGTVSIIMSIMILRVGITSTKEALFYLLDYWDDPKLLKKIRRIILKETDIVLSIKRIRMRRAGTFIFGEAFIEINPFTDIVSLREELSLMNKKIKEAHPYIKDFVIYTNIPKTKRIRIAIPITGEGSGLNAKIAATMRKTQGYEFVDIRGDKVMKKYRKKLERQGREIDNLIEFLKKEKPQIIVDNGFKSLIYYSLRHTHHIRIYPHFSNTKTVKDAVNLMMIDV